MTTSQTSIESYHNYEAKFFGEQADQKARATKFVQRQSPIGGGLFLQALVWTVFQHGAIKLGAVAETLEALEPDCQVSEQAVDQRFTAEAVAFLQAMWALALQQTLPQARLVVPLLSAFTAVYLLDSSTVTLPDALQKDFSGCGGSGAAAAAKLYLVWDWLGGQYAQAQIHNGRKADQNMGTPCLAGLPPGALWIFDLGFWNVAFLAAIVAAHSDFLARLQSQTTVALRGEAGDVRAWDLDAFLRNAPRDRVFEVAVWVGGKERVASRLICAPVPPQVANQRRRRAREAARVNGRTPSQRVLRRCDWTLLVTSAPSEQLPTTTVLAVYGVRWQVELAFKLAKSDARLEQTNSQKPYRVQCEFYAKLIAWFRFVRLLGLLPDTPKRPISPPKAWRHWQAKVLAWGVQLRHGKGWALLQAGLDYLQRRARTSVRKKYPSTRQQIEHAAQRAENCWLKDPLGYVNFRKKHKDKGQHFFLVTAAHPMVGGLA